MEIEFENSYVTCAVITKSRKVSIISDALNLYIPNHLELSSDYAVSEKFPDLVFNDESDMLTHYQNNVDDSNLFCWNDDETNITIGADFTDDGYLVISITIDADGKTEIIELDKLKNLINSKCGILSYNCYPSYENGADFIGLSTE